MTMPGPLKQQSRGRASALREQGRNTSALSRSLTTAWLYSWYRPCTSPHADPGAQWSLKSCNKLHENHILLFCLKYPFSLPDFFLLFFGHITARSASQTGSACATRTKQGANLFVEECNSLNHSSCLLAEGNCTNQGFSSVPSLAVPWEVHILTPW